MGRWTEVVFPLIAGMRKDSMSPTNISATTIDLSTHIDTTTFRCTAQRKNIIEI